MGFYIEELPTEFNGITMKEADYLADEFLKDTPCNRMWDAMRALRDFYETVINESVEVAEQTEPTTHDDYVETGNDYVEQTETKIDGVIDEARFKAHCMNCQRDSADIKCLDCDGDRYFLRDEPQEVRGSNV